MYLLRQVRYGESGPLMRYVLAAIILIHAICHLPGFAVSWRLITSPELPYKTSILWGRLDLGGHGIRVWGLVWLALAIAFAVLGAGVWTRSSWWLKLLPLVVILSTLACLCVLPEARLGLVANLGVLVLACAILRFSGGPPAVSNPPLEELWRTAPAGSGAKVDFDRIPEASRIHLQHVIAPGTPLANAVRLRMHGEIKLGAWHPFHAEEVIEPTRGMIWAGVVSMFGLPVLGSDQVIDGAGRMNWKIFDLAPVATGDGPDITRSATGRLLGEVAAWLPAALLSGALGPQWNAIAGTGSRVRLTSFGETIEVTITADERGHLRSLSFPRWGNPDGGPQRYIDFGVVVEDEGQFGGFTVPTRVRAGWYFGTDRFTTQGEFFRATIDNVEFK